MQIDITLLKQIVKECLEHQESERVIAKEFGFSEAELNALYEAVTQ